MFTQQDRNLLTAMVGPRLVEAEKFPDGFADEYAMRLGMLKRAGVSSPGLGPFLLIGLLRDFKVAHERIEDQVITVNNWRSIPADTVVMCEGRRGVFKGIAGEGLLLVKLDGYRATHEVPAASVTLSKPRIEGVDEEELEKEQLSAAQEQLLRTEQQEKVDEVWMQWNNILPGTEVEATLNGKQVTGKFVELDGDNNIVLEVGDDYFAVTPEDARVPATT